MKRAILVVPIAAVLIAGCTDKAKDATAIKKSELCTQFDIGGVDLQQTYTDLEIEMRIPQGDDPSTEYLLRERIENYCRYYGHIKK